MVFKSSRLETCYEFANPKTSFRKLTQPHHSQTIQEIPSPVVLAVGDTSYLDYKISWRNEKSMGHWEGGNGLILQYIGSELSVDSH